MEDQISEAFNIAISLAISALVIGVIVSFGYTSRKMYNDKLIQDSSISLMESKAELYDYDNRIVKGSDILAVVLENVRVYSFSIKTSSGVYDISSKGEGVKDRYGVAYGMTIWSEEYLRNTVLNGLMFNRFSAELERNESGELITGVIFRQEGS